jgi:hypothetical protein
MNFELLSCQCYICYWHSTPEHTKHLSHHIQGRSPVGISNLSQLDIQPKERLGWALLWFPNLVTGWRVQEWQVNIFGTIYYRDPRNWWWGLWRQIEHKWTVQHGNLPELRKTLTSHPPAKIWAHCLTMCFIHISHMMVTHTAQSCKDSLNKTLVFSSSYQGSFARQTIFLASLFFGWQRDRKPHSNCSAPYSSINTSISLDLPDGGTILTRTIELGTTRMQSWTEDIQLVSWNNRQQPAWTQAGTNRAGAHPLSENRRPPPQWVRSKKWWNRLNPLTINARTRQLPCK